MSPEQKPKPSLKNQPALKAGMILKKIKIFGHTHSDEIREALNRFAAGVREEAGLGNAPGSR